MTLYAQVRDGQIQRTAPAPTQPGWEDGRWWEFDQPGVVQQWHTEHGWQQVVEVARPADTADTRYVQRVDLVAGVPTQTWDAVAKTQAEKDAATAAANEATILTRAKAALATNKTFLALPAPTNAQNAAQVKALTQQVNGLIRLRVGDLTATD